jgi:hypothetical protein
MNESSLILRLILRILGAHHPIRLAGGLAIAVIVKMLVGAVAAGWPHPSLAYLGSYETWWYMIGCAPLLYLPLLIGKKGAPETVVHQINTVQALLDRAGLPRERQKLVWNALVSKYIEEAKPDLSRTPDLAELAKLELKPQGPDAPAA